MSDYVKLSILGGDGYHDEKVIAATDFHYLSEYLNKHAKCSDGNWKINGLVIKPVVRSFDNVIKVITDLQE